LNLIAGDPGSGKTTLFHQIMFANASLQRQAPYFTVIGEPPIKMLRYQRSSRSSIRRNWTTPSTSST